MLWIIKSLCDPILFCRNLHNFELWIRWSITVMPYFSSPVVDPSKSVIYGLIFRIRPLWIRHILCVAQTKIICCPFLDPCDLPPALNRQAWIKKTNGPYEYTIGEKSYFNINMYKSCFWDWDTFLIWWPLH